ncbi:MAG: SDR family oxidoreductase [Acidobacteriota bacterium]|jgi:NAD(P)-dependent dehydrogenase (short-subunit alcohol dehydrogenase family)
MGKTYVVTACNRGLGLEFARQLSARGDRVIATARDPEAASALNKLDVQVEPLDVADADSVARFAAALGDEPIDVLINNAGVGVRSRPLEQVDLEGMSHFFEVNTVGALRVTRALLEGLRSGADKKIVNITSRMGSIEDNSSGGAYEYRASKAALNMVTKSLALDFGGEGFVCVVMHPGWVQTDMGGSSAPVEVEDSISGMLRIIDRLDQDFNGDFLDFTGASLPW